MTDNELIQALRICPSMRIIVNPNAGYVITVQDILDLINRQKREIERLKKELYAPLKHYYKRGVKEFAEKLKENLDISACGYSTEEIISDVEDTIDNLVKEMTEGKHDI